MTKEALFAYAVAHWFLRDGIICSKRTDKPVSFPGVVPICCVICLINKGDFDHV